MNQSKPILITGSHRSGSTWIGKMIGNSPNVIYIGEPFNPNISSRGGICGAKFEQWFKYITVENENKYYQPILKMMNLSYDWNSSWESIKTFNDLKINFRQYMHFVKHKFLDSRVLLKDPIAVFSSEWLAQKFNMDVVMIIRHPVSFVGSLKKVNQWNFDYNNFLEQPLLMNSYLLPFKEKIEEYAQKKPNRVEHGILFWNIVYSLVSQYQHKYPNWIFVRHEDFSLNPVEEFQTLFNRLNIKFTKEIIDKINISSNTQGKEDVEIEAQEINRNSFSNISSFKNRLNQEEIDKIKRETDDICKLFYTESEWEIFDQ